MQDYKKLEEEMREFWDKNQIYKKLTERKGKKFFFLDGPPYANGVPHVGHIKNTVFKDILIRLNFMKGNQVLFQPGFDTHGLPVENMVEKKLGLGSKKEIEGFGIDKFMKECKDNAALNKEVWMRVYKKLESLYSLNKKPYMTYDDSYIQSGWWGFSKMHKKGLIYEGDKPVMWCPHCETSLAGYEVTDSYKDVVDPGIYVLFKLKDEDTSLLVFTTTPWTLPANVAVAVAPEEEYVKVEVLGKKIILAQKRLGKLSELGFGYSVIETFKGKKLVGKKYEPLLDVPLQREIALEKKGKAQLIVSSIAILKERVAAKVKTKKNIKGGDLFEEFVTMNEGTGLVHTAPGHGKTDFIVGNHYKLACVSPVDEQCNMTADSGFSGFVKKADKEIIQRLENEGKLLHKEEITHSYPLCWRCKSPLIFRLSKQLFVSIEKIKKVMMKEDKKVKWMPEFAREKFENWIENAEDWNISRQRYWGTPIPLWKCECGKERVIESKDELEKLINKKIDDLHVVENLTIKCECGKEMKKFKGILDVWFDSGVAPWASMGYPFDNKELFENHFPVGRINEAQDQIRGWFYSLLFCSCAVFDKAPYKEVSMVGWVVDKNGNKMSKSVGNIVDAEGAIDELGADCIRYYFCWDVAPYEVQKFNIDIAKKEIGKLMNVLVNLPNLCTNDKKKSLDAEDRWIISRLENMTKSFNEKIDKFEFNNAFRELTDFILNDLSRSYVQMTREKEVGGIASRCLRRVALLLAPTSPFISEKIWQNLRQKGIVKEESVHLCDWPKSIKKDINETLEKEFESALAIIETGLKERDKAKIGLKWPLACAKIHFSHKLSSELENVIARQLNVKKIEWEKDEKEIKIVLDTTMTKTLEAEGYARELARKIQSERKNAGLTKGDFIDIKLGMDKELSEMINAHLQFLKERTNSNKIEISVDKINESASVFTIKERKVSLELCNFTGTLRKDLNTKGK